MADTIGTRKIVKQLAGEEDLLLGYGSENQERFSGIVPVTRIRPHKVVDTIEDMLALDTSKYLTCNVIDSNRGGIFHYDSTQSAINDGGVVLDGWCRQDIDVITTNMFGAKSDGVTDNTVALTKALSYCSDNKRQLSVSKGTCLSGRIVIDDLTYINIKAELDATITGTSIDSLLYTRQDTLGMEMLSIVGVKFSNLYRVVDIRYVNSINRITLEDNETTLVEFPFYISSNIGIASVKRNKLIDCISDHQPGGIQLGTDIYDVGDAYVEGNIIDGVKYTGDTEGTEVHGIIVLLKNVYIRDNKLFNIRTSQPQATGCEPIYTKGFNVHIKDNYLIDAGAYGGAITIKGADVRDESSFIENNNIIFTAGYEDDTVGIQAYVNNTKIVGNYIKNSGGYGILGNSGEEAILGGLVISDNEIVNCRASYSIRFYAEGSVVENNNIVSPRYDATGYGIYFSALESNDTLTKVSTTIKNNTLYFDDDYVGSKYYFMRLNGDYSPIGNVNVSGNKVIGPYTPGNITMYMYSVLNYDVNTILNINSSEYIDIITSQNLTDCELHTNCSIWTDFPTVGTYKKGETGFYSSPTTSGFIGWVCTTEGIAGDTAVFDNFGKIGETIFDGTWTPIPSNGTDDTVFGSITSKNYTKNGNTVTVECRALNIDTLLTGDFVLKGLPYSIKGDAYGTAILRSFNNDTLGSYIVASFEASGTELSEFTDIATGTVVDWGDVVEDAADLFLSLTYITE